MKIKYSLIREIAAEDYFWEKPAICNALVNCLTPSDACAALSFRDKADTFLRRYLLKKICSDIEQQGIAVFHEQLINRLIREYDVLPAQARQSCAYCLDEISSELPEQTRDKVIKFFITCKHRPTRKRSYKILTNNWQGEFLKLVENAWEKYGEFECAQLIINHSKPDYLKRNWQLLHEVFCESDRLHWLYSKADISNQQYSKALKAEDEITYLYLCYKQNLTISQKEAKEIFYNNIYEDKIGLLIWCLGKLGFSEILLEVHEHREELLEKTIEHKKAIYS